MSTRAVRCPGDLVQLLKESNGRLLVNMFPAVGHVVPEVDNFARRRVLGEVPGDFSFLLCMPPNQLSFCVHECFSEYFHGLVINQEIYQISKQVAFHYPELTIDIGVSSLKLAPDPIRPTTKMPWSNDILYMLNQPDTGQQWLDWYRRRRQTVGYRPLDRNLEPTEIFERLLGNGAERYVIIQVKDRPTTAVATPSNVSSYLDTLAYLKDNGFTLVLVGREKYPEEFRQFGVIDYANSSVADFKHDILLFKYAKAAITAGSGIAMIADLFGTPIVYANSWHVDAPLFSAYCNAVPTLLRNRATGQLESFKSHANLFHDIGGSTGFPWPTHEPRNPDAEDMLAAIRELLEPGFCATALTSAQHQLKFIRSDSHSAFEDGRTSRAFLERFSDLL